VTFSGPPHKINAYGCLHKTNAYGCLHKTNAYGCLNRNLLLKISSGYLIKKSVKIACSHANSNMSSRRNFKNPTHGSEVVNTTIFAPLAPLGLAGPSVQKIPKKFHQIAQNKQEKNRQKNFFAKNLSPKIF
jgi:hypothetical protein